MRIPKKYGQSKVDKCPFCQKQATIMNEQGVPVCAEHKNDEIDDLKCVCGSTLDMLQGKFGIFFSCMKCGNMNLKKVLEFNTIKPKIKNEIKETRVVIQKTYMKKSQSNFAKKETTVRSDDPRYFD